MNDNYLKVALAVPKVHLGKPLLNAEEILRLVEKDNDASIVCFPELTLTGYSIGDWFHNQELLTETELAIDIILAGSTKQVWIIGAPFSYQGSLYNVALVIQNKKILGIVPKMHLPEYREFFEKRIFCDGHPFTKNVINVTYHNQIVPFGEMLFKSNSCLFGVEICEDLWQINAPNELLYESGAHIVFNLSSSSYNIDKGNRRKSICNNASYLGRGAYVYVSSSRTETSSDIVMCGHSLVSELGELIYSTSEFSDDEYIKFVDIDIEKINYQKRVLNISKSSNILIHQVDFNITVNNDLAKSLDRDVDPLPFTLKTKEKQEQVIDVISYALYHRLKHIGIEKVVLGVSGGLDSCLALLLINECFEKYGLDKSGILAFTMPGLGTGKKSKNNAEELAKALGIKLQTIDISEEVKHHFDLIGQDNLNKDVTFENIQARYRTLILMNIANKENAIVCGTSDMSEIALGWSTFNGDQMSMYNLNGGLPKTTIKELVKYFKTRKSVSINALQDILDLPISPELTGSDQKTEDIIGKYEVNDFIMYHIFINGASKKRIIHLLNIVYNLSVNEASDYYHNFMKRFCRNQFKRLTGPETVKIFEFSFSSRSDLHFPGDMKW